MTILHLDSAITGEASASRELTAAIVRELTAANPPARVIYRDLAAAPLEHLTLPTFASEESQAALAEFQAADTVVIGARGGVTYARGELVDRKWAIKLALGDAAQPQPQPV